VLTVRNLAKSYGRVKVLSDVSFHLNKGEFIAIFGSSGVGKTTLLNIVAMYDRPDEGEVVFDGINIVNASEDILERIRVAKVGFAHQSTYMIELLTLSENVALPLFLAGFSKGEREKRVTQLLEEVGLEDKAKNKPSQLSLGQRKRACIARALVADPRCILIDEPTANLDAANKQRILALLTRKQAEGAGIIVATHDPMVTKHAKVLELTDGRLAPLETTGGTRRPR